MCVGDQELLCFHFVQVETDFVSPFCISATLLSKMQHQPMALLLVGLGLVCLLLVGLGLVCLLLGTWPSVSVVGGTCPCVSVVGGTWPSVSMINALALACFRSEPNEMQHLQMT